MRTEQDPRCLGDDLLTCTLHAAGMEVSGGQQSGTAAARAAIDQLSSKHTPVASPCAFSGLTCTDGADRAYICPCWPGDLSCLCFCYSSGVSMLVPPAVSDNEDMPAEPARPAL